MNNYVVYHCHSDLSNATSSMSVDSTTKFEQYLDVAAEQGMTAFCFSEHGSVMNWVKKKQETEKRGMKYIHANEVYVTEYIDKERGLIRDNMHYMLIARNFDGVKELNKLTSISNNREDGHFYYNPRLSLDEIMNTSDNIIMTSACLASPLWRAIKKDNKQMLNRLLEFFVNNKHRMFLEIQYHNHPEQIEFNRYLYNLHKETGIPLIAGTDTHALNMEHLAARKILMKAKGATYGDEDQFDLTFKTYDELVEMFKNQNAIPRDAYMEAIYNTNVMADMVEEFTLDTTPKYPKLYENSEQVFKVKINEGSRKRGFNKFDKEKKQKYYERIWEEFDTYKALGAIDYMLLEKNIIDWCHENGIYQGYSRGSVSGSLIAYVLGITDMDSIKHKLNFTRFMNKDRVTLADIDLDFPPSRRQEVIDYVASLPGIFFSEIITFNTVALKGAIREVGRALNMPLSEVDEIAKNVEIEEEHYRAKYPELFKYVDLINGVIVSIGSHPSGFLVSPIPLDENIGLCFTKESKYPVSQINMKELEGLMYVKLDILGLDNIETINETCKLAGIERLTPDNVDPNDENVWRSIHESPLGVFQWESPTAWGLYRKLFSKETIEKIKSKNKNFSYMDLFSAGNAALRPSGDSYREQMCNGEFADHGFEPLNEFLSDTMGQLVYQEQIMQWLVDFCGFSMSQADSVRRGLAKKSGTEQFIPSIKDGFIKTMKEKYGIEKSESEKIIEPFLQVILNASSYGFSVNHSQAYSYIGYINAYLRYYYPLEYLTTLLNIKSDSIEKTAQIIHYAKSRGIDVKPIKFRKSLANYSMNKEDNTIYKGLDSIKYLNAQIAEELFELGKNQYETFIDLLVDITEKTSVNSRQLEILIKLDFFSEFGKNNELLQVYNEFSSGQSQYKKSYVEKTKIKRITDLKVKEKYIRETLKNKSLPIGEIIMFQKEHLGYADVKYPKAVDWYCVLEIDTKYTPRLTLYNLATGEETIMKMSKKNLFINGEPTLKLGDLIRVVRTETKNKKRFVDGKWVELPETEKWLVSCDVKKD